MIKNQTQPSNEPPQKSPEVFTDAIKLRLIDRMQDAFGMNYAEAVEVMLAIRARQQEQPTVELSGAIQQIVGI